VLYEGRFGTIFILVECCTDKPQRTIQPLRKLFKDHNALLVDNQVKWLFGRRGVVDVVAPLLPSDVERLRSSLVHLHRQVVACTIIVIFR
jgi:transcriptional/translational regulatory protein YebC/TACO1